MLCRNFATASSYSAFDARETSTISFACENGSVSAAAKAPTRSASRFSAGAESTARCCKSDGRIIVAKRGLAIGARPTQKQSAGIPVNRRQNRGRIRGSSSFPSRSPLRSAPARRYALQREPEQAVRLQRLLGVAHFEADTLPAEYCASTSVLERSA